MPLELHPRSIWSPHRDSGCVQVCKSLLGLRGEDWLWVGSADKARWIVVDVARGVDPAWTQLVGGGTGRHGIALAKSLAELPSTQWTFFKLPLSPRSFFPWINQILGLPPLSHVDKEPASPAVAAAGKLDIVLPLPETAPMVASVSSRAGQFLRLRRWPNLSLYADPALRLVEACNLMLSEGASFEEVRELVDDDATLMNLLADAQHQDILKVLKSSEVPAASSRVVTTRHGSGAAPAMPGAVIHNSPAAAPSLFQRFLSRFR